MKSNYPKRTFLKAGQLRVWKRSADSIVYIVLDVRQQHSNAVNVIVFINNSVVPWHFDSTQAAANPMRDELIFDPTGEQE